MSTWGIGASMGVVTITKNSAEAKYGAPFNEKGAGSQAAKEASASYATKLAGARYAAGLAYQPQP